MIVSVSLPIALNKSFDYVLPQNLEDKATFGARVKVPFGKSVQEGFITALNTNPKLPKNINNGNIDNLSDKIKILECFSILFIVL